MGLISMFHSAVWYGTNGSYRNRNNVPFATVKFRTIIVAVHSISYLEMKQLRTMLNSASSKKQRNYRTVQQYILNVNINMNNQTKSSALEKGPAATNAI